MSGRNVSGVVPAGLFEAASQTVEYDGTTMSGLVSAALALYLGLSGPARRSARYVLSKGTGEARERLLEECGRAIARAADLQLADQLAARGEAMGLGASKMSDEAIEKEAVAAVLEARAARCMGSGSERNPRMAARPRR